MDEHLSFIPLLTVVGLAFVVPLFLARFPQIPVVVGEILAGIIVGGSVLGIVHEDFTLALLAEIGFAFLLFLSGLEIDFSILTTQSPRSKNGATHPLVLATGSFLLTLMMASLVGFLLARNGLVNDPWFTALILSTTSLGIVVPVLKERGLNTTRYGQTILLAALLADLATMILITVYVAVFTSGLTFDILLIFLLFFAFMLIYRLGFGIIRRPFVRRLIEQLESATSQIKVRFALTILMTFVVLAEFVDIELILGAFLAGAVISLISRPEDRNLVEKLDAMGYGFFIPVFFVMVGVQFELNTLIENPSSLLLAFLVLLAAFAIKFSASLIFKLSFNWRETIAGGSLLSARLSLIIAAAAIGLRIEAISEATNAALILVAALTSTFSPLIFNTLLPPAKKEIQRRFLIFGAANLGIQVADVLMRHGEKVYFLEPDKSLGDLARDQGLEVIEGGSTRDCLEKAKVTEVESLLVMTGGDKLNLEVCKTAVSMGVESIVTIVNDPARLTEFTDLGVEAITPGMLRPTIIATMARNPDLFDLLTSTSDDRDIREVLVRNRALVGKPISELVFPGDSLIMTISRNGQMIIPHGSSRLEHGDRLTVAGTFDALKQFQQLVRNH
ncbi:MAG: hypothetical protein HND51_05335 [Chloroflexi bacterium]|nr:hypothetical protein [Chloroflexota bacterium]